jgi:phosphopantetheinyl transferase (holo-ACP synthase)
MHEAKEAFFKAALADAQRRWDGMPRGTSEKEKLKLQLDAVFDRLIDFLEPR